MEVIKNKTFDEERALYGSDGVTAVNCRFDGPQDGESAFKESRNIETDGCYFNLRYPFWHTHTLKINSCEMTSLCRAALWYSTDIEIKNTKMHGIKALRECDRISISDSSIISPEYGWFSKNINITDSSAEGEYFMMKAENLTFNNVTLKGKYSFQYIKNCIFQNCNFDTKDAFWHGENIVVKDSIINGEYLAWYSKNLTFINCKISGTQPLCYCEGLKLINCTMDGADLSFEKSDVEAQLLSPVISIKNPKSGFIKAPSYGELIMTEKSTCEITAY
ncbi:MAG: DUF3737 family protein [Clostridia bacterium]|nr:DUF3737 family protein [Clostridia bacterium]